MENRSIKLAASNGSKKVDVGKELSLKLGLLSEMEKSRSEVERLDTLTVALADMASEGRQESLRNEMADIQKTHDVLISELAIRVGELEVVDDKWKTFLQMLDNFSAWLAEKEQKAKEVDEANATPEEQFAMAAVCHGNLLYQLVVHLFGQIGFGFSGVSADLHLVFQH